MTEHVTRSEDETAAVGRDLARRLAPGDVVLLEGPLGAGKTAFVRGLAEGLGCDPDAVSSPTFTIVQDYAGRALLHHVDLYRLTPIEADDLGLDELVESGVTAVEWPDRWAARPADAWRVAIENRGGTTRHIVIGRP